MKSIDFSLTKKGIKNIISSIKEELNNYKHNFSDEDDYVEISESVINVFEEKVEEVLLDFDINIDLTDYPDECKEVVEEDYKVFEDEYDIKEYMEDNGYTFLDKDNYQSILDDEVDEKLKQIREKYRYDKLELSKSLDKLLL